VALQLGIAQGQPLALKAEDLAVRGHAIEARLCAEDPDTACLPQSGPVIDVEWPKLEAVRVDHGLLAGGDLPVHYDSMMAKIIAWGEDRHQARQRLQRALEQLRFIGPIDNRQLLLEALQQPAWNGESSADTTWLERWMAERPKPVIDDPWFFAAAACMLDTYIRIHGAAAGFQSTGSETDSKAAISSLLQIEAQRSARQVSIRLRSLAQGSWMMAMDHKTAMTWHPVSVVNNVTGHRKAHSCACGDAVNRCNDRFGHLPHLFDHRIKNQPQLVANIRSHGIRARCPCAVARTLGGCIPG
ncbi:MAG: hypothetical protein EBV89_12110, partial [Betaproteobacteria bacterium]|nr:hypothetical protein [Betaproteobacteria bacterium]